MMFNLGCKWRMQFMAIRDHLSPGQRHGCTAFRDLLSSGTVIITARGYTEFLEIKPRRHQQVLQGDMGRLECVLMYAEVAGYNAARDLLSPGMIIVTARGYTEFLEIEPRRLSRFVREIWDAWSAS